ncbi:benzoate/H(+) symporter BenE family transporter [Alkalilimnicola sp. S0819]|uniref:benzoate/H(+) symporter BenE family transporter n=1 Tax=Alkalilimnicola sp. S0819 TaxID=2613922 RepID=UPI001261F6B9|nr:benzoate/H(+) symporter BenE family transporter [Alkalilimnicola sp. S0819]KAB7628181.1 benzoate transporter [Alkalilimnicola sp. S0819]MPQ15068.1 benzoate transporter [Alkalilimnicola sp. S0819]
MAELTQTGPGPRSGGVRPEPVLKRHELSNGVTGFLFGLTGPLAVLITMGQASGLSESEIASWIFGSYLGTGVLTGFFCWKYRKPLSLAWTIPGAMLLPAAMESISFVEAIGAYWATGILITLLGWSGLVTRIMARIPMPIVMGMVAGVFLPLGVRVVTAFTEQAWVAFASLAGFVLFSAVGSLRRLIPPVLIALAAGWAVAWYTGAFAPRMAGTDLLVRPNLYMPAFSWQAMFELVIPLTITVLGIQNAQGIAVLKNAGHEPPIKSITVGSGLGTLFYALVGSVPACLTGPTNAILTSSGELHRQWRAGVLMSVLMVIFAIFAPAATTLALALPIALMGLVGGLAMIPALQGAFLAAFRGHCPLGALVAFVVAVAGVPILKVGAPFWALLFGLLASWLLERDSLRHTLRRGA